MNHRVLLVRYGEIGLKGRNRPQFEQALVRQVRRALAPWPGVAVYRTPGRVWVEPPAGTDATPLLEALQRVFGIVAVAPAEQVPLDLDAIAGAAQQVLEDALEAEAGRPGTPPGPRITFKVEARRSNKRFPLTSLELNRELGNRLLAAHPELKVDVQRPRITVHVEVRHDGAYVYARSVPGPGGLPVGVTGRACALLSGGIDSPVAVWMAMKRGLSVIPVHFHSPPFTSERAREKVVDLTRVLARWGGAMPLWVVHFTEVQRAIQLECPPELTITLMRRMMFRIAERIAARERALALVTGESLGQVASQTLESIRTISAVATLPVLRPLIGMDKTEIVERARAIGTYDISILPYEDCCTLFVPAHPATRPRPEQAEAAEAVRDWEPLLAEALERSQRLVVEPAPGPVA
ncbi:thiamine biosynthesis/tRNA modification protein ThiI [Thermaerobacter marianensis DSM 12885]|uniref:Probable tRNA sulfurtransferase n=1 Tax=Thermaerobacter marianensis (strain ATCC 700841 / DSM 12885 / JCM 10246 / 7p75a) TaxID=644966 RepID=E6SLU3_THEM7|nr:tRNA uracil 4-sulfurtransferase ThiI [Thermaerobacter marianensis]ADU51392.1 thiamine biosynthesis/tRNA modification protein ThiI [Thermaerobacter marianensis DSM 12885]